MEAAPGAKPKRKPPPVPPNYVSLRKLQELRLKEQEERRQREEAEAAAAAKREAEAAAAAKRDAALKGEDKSRAVWWEAPSGAKERHRGGQGQQWVTSTRRVQAAVTSRPTPTCGEVAPVKTERAVGGGRGMKGPDDAADSVPHGGCNLRLKGKWKGKEKASSCYTVDGPGDLAQAARAAPNGGKPENKSEPKEKGKKKASADQTAQSRLSGGPDEPAKAAATSSRGHFGRKGKRGAGRRSAETSTGGAPAKAAAPSPPVVVRSDNTGKPNPVAAGRADAGAGSDSPNEKKAAPPQAPPTSAAEGSSKSTGGVELRKTVEEKPEGLDGGQRRRPVVVVQAVAELNPRVARKWAEPRRGRDIEAAEKHGLVWVPKAAATGSPAGAGL